MGGGATEIIAQARAGLSQFATGSYVGTGAIGTQYQSKVVDVGLVKEIALPFKAKMFIVVRDIPYPSIYSKKNYFMYGFYSMYMGTLLLNAAPPLEQIPICGIWLDGVDKTPLSYSYNNQKGEELVYAATDSSFSWSVSIPNNLNGVGFTNYHAVYNAQSVVYHWAAFG